ncbi:MAG: zf-HC2 domain-containing protein [Leptospirales bacterium]|nr:zf-HC2 domain-containing protein [Leptospirales bacterium]
MEAIDCYHFVDLMTDYMDGELDQELKRLWLKHFEDCVECREFFASFRSSVELLAHVRRYSCPPKVQARLNQIIAERSCSADGDRL